MDSGQAALKLIWVKFSKESLKETYDWTRLSWTCELDETELDATCEQKCNISRPNVICAYFMHDFCMRALHASKSVIFHDQT